MNDNKKIAINSALLFIRLVVTSVIGLVTSRLVLEALGESDFGLYNVVGGIVVMMNVLNTAMTTTTYRYIAFEIGRGSEGNPNKVFNISLVIHILLSLLILLLGITIGSYYINNFLNITDGNFSDAHFVFKLSLLSVVISTLSIPYQGLVTAIEKFNVRVFIELTASFITLFFAISLFHLNGNNLRLYAFFMFVVITLRSLMFVFYGIKKEKNIVRFKIFKDKAKYKEMISFTGWISLGAFTSLFKSNGAAIIVNLFFGTVLNAAYGIANRLNSMVLIFSQNLSAAAIPQITKNYSGGNSEKSVKIVSYTSKYSFFLMLVIALPLLLETKFILNLWLKEVPHYSSIFAQLMIIDALILCLGASMPAMIQATGKIKYFQVVSSSISFCILPTAFFFLKFGYPPYSILVLYCFSSFIVKFVSFYLMKRLLDFDLLSFLKISTLRIVFVLLMLLPLIGLRLLCNTILTKVLFLFLTEIYLFFSIYIVGITQKERFIIKLNIIKFKSRICKK